VALELDGCHADAARTVAIGAVDDRARRLIAAARAALRAGIRAARPGATGRLTPGLVFTIEPLIVAGDPALVLRRDGWTVATADRGLSAHEEHTVTVAESGEPFVLTAAH